MDFFRLIEKRRSVRKFKQEPVPAKVIEKALDSALLAANSSNLQPWEFYWVKEENNKDALVKACFSQGAARTAQELIVAVSRIDTWKRNRNLIVKDYKSRDKFLPIIDNYYNKLIPLIYLNDRFGILGVFRKFISLFINLFGFFRPVLRSPMYRHELFEVVTKSTALACQNLMMALVAQGYDSCPMEGFDEKRVKKILKLNAQSHVVMVLGIGKADEKGVYGERFRINKELTVKEI